MGRNGLQTVEAAAEPDDLYDQLSQDAKDIWDEVGSLGYTPEKGIQGLWFARRPGQKASEAVGPADSLTSLLSQVKAALPPEPADEAEERPGETRPDGDDYLFDEMRPKGQEIVNELEYLADEYDRVKLERVDWSAKETAAKKALNEAMRKHEVALAVDPATGVKSYRTKSGVIAELVPGDYALKTRHATEDEA